jgi:hypothetical protein
MQRRQSIVLQISTREEQILHTLYFFYILYGINMSIIRRQILHRGITQKKRKNNTTLFSASLQITDIFLTDFRNLVLISEIFDPQR